MAKRKWVLLGFLLLPTLFFIRKGGSMHWIRAPYYSISDIEGDDFVTTAFQKAESGRGFLGGYTFNSDEEVKNSNYRADISIHKSLIQKTEDNWKTRITVFEGNGEIEGFFNIGNGNIIARNTQVEKVTLRYSAQFLLLKNSLWNEVSRLDFMITKFYGSESLWFLAAGFSEDKDNLVYSFVSSDGAGTWFPVDLHGFNPTTGNNNSNIILSKSGKLWRFSNSKLDYIDFSNAGVFSPWMPIAISPQSIRNPSLVLLDNSIKVIGTLSDSTFGIWNMRLDGLGPNSIQTCTGIPKEFSIEKMISRGGALYLVGTVLTQKNGETTGIKFYVLRSNQEGMNWTDLQLPITSGLTAVDFGEEGSIWAAAPGNRIQIFNGVVKN